MSKPKVITLCGSSRFCDIMAVVAWILERDELAIAMGLHLLPDWYSVEEIPDQMDDLHLRKIDMSDEIFVIDAEVDGEPYIGSSTANEIRHAESRGLPVRRFSEAGFVRYEVYRRLRAAVDAQEAASPERQEES